MVFVTGDTHGELDINKLSNSNFGKGRELTKNDYVIICGDFGVVWNKEYERTEKYYLDFLNKRKFTTLVVHGNHDNIPRLNSYPDVEMFGSTVKQISDSVFYLLNGNIYTIEGKTYYVMGGAMSIDKDQRRPGYTWWPEEIPSMEIQSKGFENLEKVGNKVNIILTHAPCRTAFNHAGYTVYNDKFNDPMLSSLDQIYQRVQFDHWYCGHMHIDWTSIIDPRLHFLYYKIEKVV